MEYIPVIIIGLLLLALGIFAIKERLKTRKIRRDELKALDEKEREAEEKKRKKKEFADALTKSGLLDHDYTTKESQ